MNNIFDSGKNEHLYDSNPNKIPVSDRNTHVLSNFKKANKCVRARLKKRQRK